MAETIALVTGANKGIGREISRQLAAQGVFVLLGARDRERGEKLEFSAMKAPSRGEGGRWLPKSVNASGSQR
jgi:NAD(P)-dependent dehydrogenase (short-subunit alcohol dehydrogenase family)